MTICPLEKNSLASIFNPWIQGLLKSTLNKKTIWGSINDKSYHTVRYEIKLDLKKIEKY